MIGARRRDVRGRPALALGLLVGVAVTFAGCGQTPAPVEPGSSRGSAGPLIVSSGCIAEQIEANPAALYFAVTNRGPDDDALVGVIADGVDRADIHRTVARGGIAWMEPASEVAIPAGGSVRFVPGGHHVMLQTSSRRLRRGATVGVQLVFRRAGTVPLQIPVVAYADLDRLLGQASPRIGAGPS
ncbi:MAG TPA: copper chaperone PCu(A)C [Candidatus Nitrosotalea sp.]|nr:copper chaperone PCu(A)C [Candidatus Nitrosotalea sp.]